VCCIFVEVTAILLVLDRQSTFYFATSFRWNQQNTALAVFVLSHWLCVMVAVPDTANSASYMRGIRELPDWHSGLLPRTRCCLLLLKVKWYASRCCLKTRNIRSAVVNAQMIQLLLLVVLQPAWCMCVSVCHGSRWTCQWFIDCCW